jgi:hypothetical protein
MALGTDHITRSIVDSGRFIPEVWSPEILRATEAALVMANLVKRYDSMVQDKGDVIHIPQLSNLTANSKTAQTQVELQNPTETEVTIAIDQHYEASFLIEDIARVQSNYDLMAEYTSKAGYAIAKQIDTDLLSLYSTLTSTDVGTYGTDIGDATILSAIETLDGADVPEEDRQLVIHYTQKPELLNIDKFVRADYLGNYQTPKPAVTGVQSRFLWGDIYGFPVYYSTNVPLTSATPNQIHNIFFHKEAFALALQLAPRVQTDYILEYLSNLVVVDVIYGFKTIRPTFGVEVRS